MSQLLTSWTVLALLAITSPVEDNRILNDLQDQGVAMPGGARVKLPPPILADSLGAEAQRAAITRLAEPNYSWEDFTNESRMAPYTLKMESIPVANSPTPARTIHIAFIAYGDWKTINSQTFLAGLARGADTKSKEGELSRSAVLSDMELAKRGIHSQHDPNHEDVYFAAAGQLFDRVQLGTTWHGMLTRGPDSAVLAARIDPRFTHDAEYPNQWRPLSLDDAGNLQTGPAQPYHSAAFYGKVTRLAEPADAMLFEYHIVFDEPEGWFGGANLLRSKLPLVLQDQIRSFRKKLATASGGK
jgi:hypothetical protein